MKNVTEYESMASVLDITYDISLNGQPEVKDQVILMRGSDLKPEPIQWIWKDWLALGKMHLLAGAPGQGKTTIAIAFAATVSSGGRWPDGTKCEAGNVLIWSGEDDPKDTLLPRLIASGADIERCYFIEGTRLKGEITSFDPARDFANLEEQCESIGGVKLIVVDPVVSAVTGDSHKNTEVRRALQPLVDLSNRAGAALVGISHFSKAGAGGDPTSRVVGSIAFTAVARVVMVAAKVKSEDGESDRRILARSKSNIGPDDGGFEYNLEQSEPIPGIQASHISWGNPVEGTARQLFTDPHEEESSGDESNRAIEQAKNFLNQALSSGTTPSKTIFKEARDAGVSGRTLRRASVVLNVIKTRGQGSVWYWKLPHVVHLGQDSKFGQVGQHEAFTESTNKEFSELKNQVGQVGQEFEIGHHGQHDDRYDENGAF